MKNRLGLATLAMATLLSFGAPGVASADDHYYRDRDHDRHERKEYERHLRHERKEAERRWREQQRWESQRWRHERRWDGGYSYGNPYRSGYYDSWGNWHPYR